MAVTILIETSTSLCSTAIGIDGKVASYRESSLPRAHASMTAPFIKECLEECGLGIRDCDAVCVSMGPGSYTGLRVGSSTAKGLCFGAGLPLIAIGTLDSLCAKACEEGLLPEGCRHIVPMVDARRMEVYCASFTPEGVQESETSPQIVREGSFSELLSQGPTLFIGDGALKCKDVLKSDNAYFYQCFPDAKGIASLAERAYKEKRFQDVAYFEPFYLKQFVATVSSRKLF